MLGLSTFPPRAVCPRAAAIHSTSPRSTAAPRGADVARPLLAPPGLTAARRPPPARQCCREEIAGGFEKAYGDSGLPQAEAARLLFLQDPKEVTTIAETRGWKVVGSNYEFPAPEAASKTVPAPDLIERSLSYALELEKIV